MLCYARAESDAYSALRIVRFISKALKNPDTDLQIVHVKRYGKDVDCIFSACC